MANGFELVRHPLEPGPELRFGGAGELPGMPPDLQEGGLRDVGRVRRTDGLAATPLLNARAQVRADLSQERRHGLGLDGQEQQVARGDNFPIVGAGRYSRNGAEGLAGLRPWVAGAEALGTRQPCRQPVHRG